MLIVNADDLGRNTATTDAILSCYAKKRISSTSVMVFMEDSERAAGLALSAGIDVGLHINFSETFSAKDVPTGLADSHGRIIRFLKTNKYALLLYHPLLAGNFRSIFEAQQAEFLRLYGRLPSHYDGHQHLHLASNMVMQQILPKGSKVRRSFSFRQGEKSFVNRCYRTIIDRSLARRHMLTDYFFSLAHHLTLDRLERVINLAKEKNVELMAHPHLPKEYDFLMSEAYGELLAQVDLAGFDALQANT
jgi:chitin disaccharide deacetylase